MPTLMAHYRTWVDLVVDLSRHCGATYPRHELFDQFADSFDCVVSWNWIAADGSFGFELREPVPGFPPSDDAEMWAREGMALHPLGHWFARTLDPNPMTVGRVPRRIAPARGFALVAESMGPFGMDQQLSIPHRLSGHMHQTFILAQGGGDFTEGELDLARRIQPLLAVLDRQSQVLASTAPLAGHAAGLTSREVAVLGLLGAGLTASAIGHRLLISQRTVHAHLGNIYRKLEVTDRMRAVLVAQERGILPPLVRVGDARSQGADDPAGRWSARARQPLPEAWIESQLTSSAVSASRR